jgi:hypothetical protein
MDDVVANQHIPVRVAPDKGSRDPPKRWLTDTGANWMRTVLKSDDGRRVQAAPRALAVEQQRELLRAAEASGRGTARS